MVPLRLLPTGDGRALVVCSDGMVYVAGNGEALLCTYTHACGLVRASSLLAEEDSFLLALCDTDKHLAVVRLRPSAANRSFDTHIVARVPLPKAATCAAFHVHDDTLSVLVGDKFGDVSRVVVAPVPDEKPSIVAGCVSSVTDMCMGTMRPRVDVMIFSDRDEKVRLVRACAPYPIEAFLLAHASYVAGVAALAGAGESLRVVSVGGDNALMVWDVPSTGGTVGTPVSRIAIVPDAQTCDPVAVAVCNGRVAVAVSGEHCVRMFTLSPDGILASGADVPLSAEVTAISFDSDGSLFAATLSSVVRVGSDHAEWPLLRPATDLPRSAVVAHTTVRRKCLYEGSSRDAAGSASEDE